MDPLTASIIFGTGANVASGLFAPSGEDVQGFRDIPIDGQSSRTPRQLLGQGISQVGRLSDVAEERLARPVSLPGAFAQTPPSFSGGGLPLDIGVTGVDPALLDPSLLSLEGFKLADPQGFVDDKLTNPKFPSLDDKLANPKFPGSDEPPVGRPGHEGQAGTVGRRGHPAPPTTFGRRRLSAGLSPTRSATAGTSSDDLIASEGDRALAALFLMQAAKPGAM